MAISIFWTKFIQKRYFRPKTKEFNTTIEFCVPELVSVPNFSLNWKFWFFGPNLPKKGIFGQKQEKSTAPLNCIYSNYCGYQIEAQTDNCDFLNQIYSKRVFLVKNRKNEHNHWILHIRINVGTEFQCKLTILIFWAKLA